ncbi:MAG: tetratricopeptide repeat protein, partial [Thermoplasmata archaeon]|nr:tetratricopeptide repeat protein [Thermoplasmata archaeon]
ITNMDVLKQYIDLNEKGEPDSYSKNMLDSLKKELSERLPEEHIYSYSGVMDGSLIGPNEPKGFANKVYEDLKAIVFQQLDEIREEDALTQEITRHNVFAELTTIDFTGRKEVVESILRYLSGPDNRVYALLGSSGSGKTVVMARTSHLAREQARSVIITRFLGTTGAASHFDSLLAGIDDEIAQQYGADINFIRGTGEKRKMEKDAFQACLMWAARERPLVIFFDAIDQLPVFGRQMLMQAIPKTLPTYCRIVLSGTSEVEPLVSGMIKEQLLPMTKREGESLLTTWLVRADRKLRDDQKNAVIGKLAKNGLPLYLKLIFENVKRWRSYDTSVPALSDNIEGMLDAYFDELEHQHTKELVSTLIGYMLSSRHRGLPENEALELLARDGEYWTSFLREYPYFSEEAVRLKRLPSVLWSRLRLDLDSYLTERIEDGATLLIFYHWQFGQYANNAYVRGNEVRYCHILGEYGAEVMRTCGRTGGLQERRIKTYSSISELSSLPYTALYSLVSFLRAGMDKQVRDLIYQIFSATRAEDINGVPVDKLNVYVIKEGSKNERNLYYKIIEGCGIDMPNVGMWVVYLGLLGDTYQNTVFQEWAIFYYQKAILLLEEIHAKDPGNINMADYFAKICGSLGDVLMQRRQPKSLEAAEKHYRKAIAILEGVHAKNADNIEIAVDLHKTYNNLGILLSRNNRPEEANAYDQKAIFIVAEIHKRHPDNVDIADSLATSYINIAPSFYESNRKNVAEEYCLKAIAILEKMTKLHTNDSYSSNLCQHLASSYQTAGKLFRENNRISAAKEYYQKAISLLEKSSEQDPDDIVMAIRLAAIYNNLGFLFQNINQLEAAEEYYQKSRLKVEEIRVKDPGNVVIAETLGRTYLNMESLFQQSNRPDEADQYKQKALNIIYDRRPFGRGLVKKMGLLFV